MNPREARIIPRLIASGLLAASVGLAACSPSRPSASVLSQSERQATAVALGTPTVEPPRPKPTEIPLSSDEQLIKDEAARLGFILDEGERELWQQAYGKPTSNIEEGPLATGEAKQRVDETLQRMLKSKNPDFARAAMMYFSPEVSVNIYPHLATHSADIVANSYTAIKGGKLHYATDIDANAILNTVSSFGLAVLLTHEAKHLDDHKLAALKLPQGLTIEEQVQMLNEAESPEEVLESEIRAYFVHARAYLTGIGLSGFRDEMNTSFERDAVAFVRAGRSVNSPLWREHVTRRTNP